ncbi:MAG: HEPN domain-containing protein [Candidatus Aenigmatarchaeota archaeon]
MGEILKERADEFVKLAEYAYKRKRYDLAMFNLEQAIQLYLKYKIWQKLGDFEKTHSITKLLKDFGRVYKKSKVINKFIKENLKLINDLEVAYIESRYLPAQFLKEDIDRVFEFLDKLKNLINL